MIMINAMFSRQVRKPHRRTRTETKNVTRIAIDREWEDQKGIRQDLAAHKPEGEGWVLGAYALVEGLVA